jgi:DNA repair exonuclease SbcCD ATPase subunit
MKAVSFFIFTWLISLTTVQAQQPGATTPRPAAPAQQSSGRTSQASYSLQQQFNSMKFRSSSYQEFNHDYKVVRVDHLDRFWKNVQDSLKGREQSIRQAGKNTEKALVQARQDLQAQQAEVKALKLDNQQKEQAIQKTSHDVASLSVFGLDMNKQLYVILSWVVILGLGILAGVFVYLYKKSKVVTDQKIHAFEEISQEYKEHKQNAREREIKIKRELQTEANKVEELNQQIAQLKKQVST